jgi:hypothetical protein
LGIALKNDIDQVTELAINFDFAINEQCFQYDECTALNTFIQQVIKERKRGRGRGRGRRRGEERGSTSND